jgi:hypothetical protein
MKYSVKKQYARGSDLAFAEFNELPDAELFIENKLKIDTRLNVKVIYKIYELNEVIATFDPDKVAQSQDQGTQGKSSTASFRPTPFNTAPRPTGTPPKWLKDDEEEDKK